MTPKFQSHEQYIAAAPEEVQAILRRIQQQVQSALPQAVPCISYNMPAFRMGKVFFYFAAFKKHIGIYPPVSERAALAPQLSAFRGPKGNLIFPLSQPMPYKLIEQVALVLASQHGMTNNGRSKHRTA